MKKDVETLGLSQDNESRSDWHSPNDADVNNDETFGNFHEKKVHQRLGNSTILSDYQRTNM